MASPQLEEKIETESRQDPRFQKMLSAFREGLERELEAQKRQSRRSDLRVIFQESLESKDGRFRTSFRVDGLTDSLVAGVSGQLLGSEKGEIDVKVEFVEGQELVCASQGAVENKEYRLSLSPWFLFERLQDQLDKLQQHASPRQVQAGLQAFGIVESTSIRSQDVTSEDLNAGQLAAVNLALSTSVTRIWGPPGTGKTTTLAILVAELLARGERVLLTSNTHAALDQVLSGLLKREQLRNLVDEGLILRLGRCLPDHRDCSVRTVTRRMHSQLRGRWDRSEARLTSIRERIGNLQARLEALRLAAGPNEQLSLFEQGEPEGLPRAWLVAQFGSHRGDRWAGLSLPTQLELLERHQERLKRLKKAHNHRIAQCRDQLAEQERQTVGRARVVLSTLANLTTSDWMDGEQFDNVIVEEAGMAILPAFFSACSRSLLRTLAVGDPRQLPSILTSRDAYVQRTLGRNIFEVGQTPQAMLTTQYRMHPEIGDLVSHLAYQDQLMHARGADDFLEWTSRDPVEGVALVGFDLRGASTCQKQPGGTSRFNEESAVVCIKLAARAVAAGFTEIAIISPYRQQIRKIRSLMSAELAPFVECDTVHRYQGKERALVIVDLVDTESFGPGALLRDDAAGSAQLLNVAFSRAQYKLFLVGELNYLCRQSPESFVGRAIMYLAKHKKLIKVVKAKS